MKKKAGDIFKYFLVRCFPVVVGERKREREISFFFSSFLNFFVVEKSHHFSMETFFWLNYQTFLYDASDAFLFDNNYYEVVFG